MLSTTRSIAKPKHSAIGARLWKRLGLVVGWVAVATICVVVAIPVSLGIYCLQHYILVDALKDERLCLVPFALALLFVPRHVRPWIGYSFGSRSGNRYFGRRVIPESIAFLQYDLRRLLLVLLVAQLASLAAAYWGPRGGDGQLEFIRSQYWLLLIPLVFGAMGFVLAYFGRIIFLHTRGRKKGVWKVNRRRGVSLRDFIWKYDTKSRPIFHRCRISRRVAGAFSAVTMTAAGCFAAMGCLGSLLAPNHYLAVTINCVSLVATAWFWPTPRRLVRWTAHIIAIAPE